MWCLELIPAEFFAPLCSVLKSVIHTIKKTDQLTPAEGTQSKHVAVKAFKVGAGISKLQPEGHTRPTAT